MKTYKRIEAVKTSFRILDFLKEQRRPVAGAEVARALTLSHSAAMSYLSTLEDIGAVQSSGGHFQLASKMILLSASVKKDLEEAREDIDRALKLINL